MLSAQEFDREEYNQNPIKSKPFLLQKMVDPNKTNFEVYNIQRHFMESDDKLLSLGLITTNEEYMTYHQSY